MLRTDVSFSSCLRETIAWTASTEQGSIFHTACITSFSNSASGGRMTARTVVVFVMVQVVPHAGAIAKRNLHGLFACRDLSLNHRDIPSVLLAVRIRATYA